VTEVKGRKGSHEELTVPSADREQPAPRERGDRGAGPKKHGKGKSKKEAHPRAKHPVRGGGPRHQRNSPGRGRRRR
jgi:hypothetical protein